MHLGPSKFIWSISFGMHHHRTSLLFYSLSLNLIFLQRLDHPMKMAHTSLTSNFLITILSSHQKWNLQQKYIIQILIKMEEFVIRVFLINGHPDWKFGMVKFRYFLYWIRLVLGAIVELLANPNFDDYVIEHDIVRMYQSHQSKYEKTAQTWVDKYAR